MTSPAISVLLVDDDDDYALILEDILQSAAYRVNVAFARDGASALRFLRERRDPQGMDRTDLVFLDLRMPCLDGHGVLAEMRRDDLLSKIPVIVMTNGGSLRDRERVLESGAACCLTKYASAHEILQAIDRCMDTGIHGCTADA